MALMYFTEDPAQDYEDYYEQLDEEQRYFEEHSPLCPICGKRTGKVSNQGYFLMGQWFCEKCVESSWRDLPDEE